MPRKAPSWLGDEATWVRAGLWLALLGTVAGGVSCSREKPESCEPARHVIVISLDTTRADHLGCYGNTEVRTPNIDALAAESILFTDYMTVVPTTLSSHLSLFTGKYSHTHGTPRNGFMVNRENLLLTEILQEAGFHTAGFIGSFALESRFDFNQGFDHYDERFERFVSVIGAEHNERPAESVTNAVISYLDEIGIPDKLLLFVHYFDPHEPYDPPPPYNTMYGGARRVTPEHTEVVRQGIRQAGHEATVEAQVLARNYAGEISYMDEHVGRLLEDLRQRGVLDQALVLVTSDHGENFWEHRFYFNHGLTTYQTTLHAVCLLRLPRAAHGGTRVEQLVASIDVLPTLLSYLGLEIPPGVEGEALDLARIDAGVPARIRFAEASKPWENVETDPRWTNIRKARCVRDGQHKYIWTPYLDTEELYDVVADPLEQNDLLADPTPDDKRVALRLRQRLEEWTNSAAPLPSRFESSQLEETVRRLHALGYLAQPEIPPSSQNSGEP